MVRAVRHEIFFVLFICANATCMFVSMWPSYCACHRFPCTLLKYNTHQHFRFHMCCFHCPWITLRIHKKTDKHICAWSAISGSSSLGCGVANRTLSSVFPAGHLTVTLFPSCQTGRQLVPTVQGVKPYKRVDRNMYICNASSMLWVQVKTLHAKQYLHINNTRKLASL